MRHEKDRRTWTAGVRSGGGKGIARSLFHGSSALPLVALLAWSWSGGAYAAEDQAADVHILRVCDPSGCYLAWSVVDTDGDGVCDADEIMAGTDPRDPRSRPSLALVAEVGAAGQLPSFESGLGAFVVFPEALEESLESRTSPDALAVATAFPAGHARGETLERLGIDAALLAERGIDVARDGLVAGFGGKTPADSESGGPPPRRVGGIDVRLVSADDDLVPLKKVEDHGAQKKVQGYADGGVVVTYMDGYTRTTQTDGTVVWRNEDGGITRVTPGPGKYVNPDADDGAPSTMDDEAVARRERLRGAALRTVDGWSPPGLEEEPRPDRRALVILVDPEQATDESFGPGAFVLSPPRLADAQPEGRPDLPSPIVPHP